MRIVGENTPSSLQVVVQECCFSIPLWWELSPWVSVVEPCRGGHKLKVGDDSKYASCARARMELATFSKEKGLACVSHLEQCRGVGDVTQLWSSDPALQRGGSEPLFEKTELGLSSGGETTQQLGVGPSVKERSLGAFVHNKDLGQVIGMGLFPESRRRNEMDCLTKAQGALVGLEGSFRRLEGPAHILPFFERASVISQRVVSLQGDEGKPCESQLSVEDVKLALEQRTPLVFYALSLDATNGALMEEAARFPGQIPFVLSLGGDNLFSSTPSPSSLPYSAKILGPLVCWEDSGGFSMDGDALEPGPLCIAQLDGSEVQWPSHLVCFRGNESKEGAIEEAFSDETFGRLLLFSRFVGLPVDGFENEILTMFRSLECRKRGKDFVQGGKKNHFLRSKVERELRKLECSFKYGSPSGSGKRSGKFLGECSRSVDVN